MALHVVGAVLCNARLIKRSFLLVLPFFFFFSDSAHVYFSFSFYFFLFIQLLFLLLFPVGQPPSSSARRWGYLVQAPPVPL